jgi:hypothetical protein
MDRYVSRDLQNMVCKELEGIAKKKEIDTPATVELLKGLTGSLKNLMKIDKLEMEKEEPMEMMKGYSQRSMGRYYVDGTYGGQRDPWGYGDYSYAQGGRGMDSGNSYRYPMGYPMYDNRYSRTGEDREEMKREMMKLMESTNDEKMRKSILEVMNKM